MRKKFPVIIPVLVLLAALFVGGNLLGRSTLRQGQNGVNRQTRNFVGLRQPSASPNTNIYKGSRMGVVTTPGITLGTTPRTTPYGTGQQMGFDRQKADNISRKLNNIAGIRQINTIVKGNTALIGYTPSGKTSNANTVRKTITDRVKQLDGTITNVVVSDSADFSTQIRRLGDKISSSKPVEDLNSEFNKLMQNMKTGSL